MEETWEDVFSSFDDVIFGGGNEKQPSDSDIDKVIEKIPTSTLETIEKNVGKARFRCALVEHIPMKDDDIEYHKGYLLPCDLNYKQRRIYDAIIASCPTEESLRYVKAKIDQTHLKGGRKVSGRIIDTLVTRFSMFGDCFYYLDYTDPRDLQMVLDIETVIDKSKVKLFDVSNSYGQHMTRYSKTYFDCFSRGVQVKHKLGNGKSIMISLCQFNFYIWALRYKVLDFLSVHYEKVIGVRKLSSKYKPKRKRKSNPREEIPPISSAVMCPPILFHKKYKSKHVVRLASSSRNS